MPTQRRLPLIFPPEVERELMRKAFERLPAAARQCGFEVALQNGAMAIGLRRMAEALGSVPVAPSFKDKGINHG